MLIRGGVFGVEGQGILGGEGQQGTGTGSSIADGATILSLKGSMTLLLLLALLGRIEGGESPLLPSSPHCQGWPGARRARHGISMVGFRAHLGLVG
jgi:hypothetical protein